MVRPYSLTHLLENNLTDAARNAITIPFYKQILDIWNKHKSLPTGKREYLEQILWNNELIQLPVNPKSKRLQTLKWPELYNAGIVKVKDLVTDEGNIIDIAKFCTEHNIKHNFLQVIRLRKAIPSEWVAEIASTSNSKHASLSITNPNFILKDDEIRSDVLKVSTKRIYQHSVYRKSTRPTALDRWLEHFDIDDSDWQDIFRSPYIACRETK